MYDRNDTVTGTGDELVAVHNDEIPRLRLQGNLMMVSKKHCITFKYLLEAGCLF